MRSIKYFRAVKKFLDNLYHDCKDDAAYVDEGINYLKIDLHHPMSEKIVGINTRHPVFRLKCKKNKSYRIFYAWDKYNVVILEIDIRDDKTYNRNMINKLRNRVRIAETEGFLA